MILELASCGNAPRKPAKSDSYILRTSQQRDVDSGLTDNLVF